MRSKQITDHCCCRSLDHNTKLNLAHRLLFSGQLQFNFFHDLFDSGNLFDRDDHREHDGQGSVSRCTIQCTKLCTEDILSGQTDTDRTISKCRVVLFRKIEVINLFICTDIHGTNDNFLTVHTGKNCLICLKLYFLTWIIITSKIQELTSEQADTFCIVLKNSIHILDSTDIGIQMNMFST